MPRIGCVSYLNAKPLIEGLADPVRLEVPARLTRLLQNGEVDIALCPVADILLHQDQLESVPVGGISSDGETLTVKVFSRVPPGEVRHMALDTDSRTSVNLMRVLWQERHGFIPAVQPLAVNGALPGEEVDALLLIGDKVISGAPDSAAFPWTLDLGAAWKQATGLPFVFALWTQRRGDTLGDLPGRLARQLAINLPRRSAIADQHAEACGWPPSAGPLARRYLSRILHYEIGPRELEAIRTFHLRLAALPTAHP